MSAAPTQQMNGTPLFTVEQIELIRRLRNSGVSKEQLVQAWDALGRLDRELGPVYTVPITIAAAFQQQAQALQRASLNAAFSALAPPNVAAASAAANAAAVANVVANAANNPVLQLPQTPLSTAAVQPAVQPQPQPQSSPQSNQSSTPEQVSRKRSVDGTPVGNGDLTCDQSFLSNGGIPQLPLTPNDLVNLINGVTENGEDAEESQEYREFVSKGEPLCTEEIKAFIVQNNIKQQQIATLAGISQSYVSRYLKGDYYDMSERSRRAIQKWYILYRKYPGAIVPAVNAVTLMNPSPEKKVATVNEVSSMSQMATPVNGDFLKYPRRERFVFRPNHLEILEKYFQEDNYPSFEKREEISKACNAATEAMTGRELGDKERVTAQIISNWFANKRKELKKIAREEGLDVSQVPLRSRGRPSRLYSDLAMMQAMERSGNHANMMPHNFPSHPEFPLSETNDRQSLLMSSQPVTPRTPDTPQGMEPSPGEVESQVANNGPSIEALKTEASNDAALLEGESEESLSWSVEIAAVNQAILSLTGQQPIKLDGTKGKVDNESTNGQEISDSPAS